MTTVPIQRRRAMQRAADRIVHHFQMHARVPRMRKDDPELFYPIRGHYQVRVFLQRNLGWSYIQIEKRYGIPLRSAKRYMSKGYGKKLIDRAVKMGRLGREQVVRDVLGQEL